MGVHFCVLLFYVKIANFELELRECASCTITTSLAIAFGAALGALGLTPFALCVLLLHFKLASFQLELRDCTSRTKLRSCIFRAGAAGVRFAYYLRT